MTAKASTNFWRTRRWKRLEPNRTRMPCGSCLPVSGSFDGCESLIRANSNGAFGCRHPLLKALAQTIDI